MVFNDIKKEVNLIEDIINSDMAYENIQSDNKEFTKRLFGLKYWFVRTSWSNKKRFLLALIHDMRTVWAVSVLLKSIWTAINKDTLLSIFNKDPFCGFDRVPMDHNRMASPVSVLVQTMLQDRKWFCDLNPETQAYVVSELLTLSGGPLMVSVQFHAMKIYNEYHKEMLIKIEASVMSIPTMAALAGNESQKSFHASSFKTGVQSPPHPTRVPADKYTKEIEKQLGAWSTAVKSLRDSFKLEEVEVTVDNKSMKIWKVDRPIAEATETVDFVQVLPSEIAKLIFCFFSGSELAELAKVNKYWCYIITELTSEFEARAKINTMLENLQTVIMAHDTSLQQLNQPRASLPSISIQTYGRKESLGTRTVSRRSAPSSRLVLDEKLLTTPSVPFKPIVKLKDLSERLEIRGAADEAIPMWCEGIINCTPAMDIKLSGNCLKSTEFQVFPCPLSKFHIRIPPRKPILYDPSFMGPLKANQNILNEDVLKYIERVKKLSLWSRDFTSLFNVYKIPFHLSPI